MDLIKRDLDFLTSPATAGRLSGTDGARRVSDYLAAALAALGMEPAGAQGFSQWLEVPAARLAGPVRLSVDGVTYQYRRDFADLTRQSAGGTVRADLAVVRDGDALVPADLAGKAILIPERPEGFDIEATVAAAVELGVAALLVEWGEPTWFHKTLFGSADRRIPVLRVRTSVAAHLAASPGARVELDLPLVNDVQPCQNVVGILPGTDATKTVALTAHYDHVGDDPGGERFPGAVDNATGVVTILEAIRDLIEGGVRLPFNLLVGFMTGEESGFWGAKYLAAHPPVPLTAAINLDGMGYEESLQAIRLGYSEPGNWLADLAAETYAQKGIEVIWSSASDDSVALQAAGLPALGLGQMATKPMPFGFHSPEDTADVVHLPVIHEGADTIVTLLRRLALHPALTQTQHSKEACTMSEKNEAAAVNLIKKSEKSANDESSCCGQPTANVSSCCDATPAAKTPAASCACGAPQAPKTSCCK